METLLEKEVEVLYEIIDNYSNLDGVDGIYEALKRWVKSHDQKIKEEVIKEIKNKMLKKE